jgi:hypothetical protein
MAGTFGYECPTCGNLWIFWDGWDEDPTVDAPLPTDATSPARVFGSDA